MASFEYIGPLALAAVGQSPSLAFAGGSAPRAPGATSAEEAANGQI